MTKDDLIKAAMKVVFWQLDRDCTREDLGLTLGQYDLLQEANLRYSVSMESGLQEFDVSLLEDPVLDIALRALSRVTATAGPISSYTETVADMQTLKATARNRHIEL